MRARRGVWCVRCEWEGASCVTVCVGRYARGAEVCGEFGLGWTCLWDAVRGPAAECGPAVVLPRIYICYDVVPTRGVRAMASGNYDSLPSGSLADVSSLGRVAHDYGDERMVRAQRNRPQSSALMLMAFLPWVMCIA